MTPTTTTTMTTRTRTEGAARASDGGSRSRRDPSPLPATTSLVASRTWPWLSTSCMPTRCSVLHVATCSTALCDSASGAEELAAASTSRSLNVPVLI